jgi:dihydropyrimidine dehydrogenase (NAD+) subunit PreA
MAGRPGRRSVTDLATSFASIPLRNPFMLASAPPTDSADRIAAANALGWAGAVTKTVTSSPQYQHNPWPSIRPPRTAGWRRLGLLNNEVVTAGSLEHWCEYEIPRIRQLTSRDFCVGVSVMEGPTPAAWEATAFRVSRAGATYVELNVSCPHGQPEKFRGSHIGDDPDLLREVVAAACAGSSVPVAVKLNATSPELVRAGHAALKGGAAGLVCTNTFAALPAISHLLGVSAARGELVTPMGLSGPAILPQNRLAVQAIARSLGCSTAAAGGVSSAADAIDYLMLGASAVQVGTAVMTGGPHLVRTLQDDLRGRLRDGGLDSVRQVVGSGLALIGTADVAQEVPGPMTARVDAARCFPCPQCTAVCSAGGADCIVVQGPTVVVDAGRCTGCGLCVLACPRHALSLQMLRETTSAPGSEADRR